MSYLTTFFVLVLLLALDFLNSDYENEADDEDEEFILPEPSSSLCATFSFEPS
jgi:hypothetical protein